MEAMTSVALLKAGLPVSDPVAMGDPAEAEMPG